MHFEVHPMSEAAHGWHLCPLPCTMPIPSSGYSGPCVLEVISSFLSSFLKRSLNWNMGKNGPIELVGLFT